MHDGLVDLLIGSDNAELRYLHADLQGKHGGPIDRLYPLGWIPLLVSYTLESLIGVREKNPVAISTTA